MEPFHRSLETLERLHREAERYGERAFGITKTLSVWLVIGNFTFLGFFAKIIFDHQITGEDVRSIAIWFTLGGGVAFFHMAAQSTANAQMYMRMKTACTHLQSWGTFDKKIEETLIEFDIQDPKDIDTIPPLQELYTRRNIEQNSFELSARQTGYEKFILSTMPVLSIASTIFLGVGILQAVWFLSSQLNS